MKYTAFRLSSLSIRITRTVFKSVIQTAERKEFAL